MLVKEKLDLIRYTLVTFSNNFENYSPMTRRLFAIGVVTELLQLNRRLDMLCIQLDSEISVEDAEIDFDDWLEHNDWMNDRGIFNILSYHPQKDGNDIIDNMNKLLPVNYDGYGFTEDDAGKFLTAMHEFCDDESLQARDIIYIIGECIKKTLSSLREVKRKRTNIQGYLFEDYWYSFIDGYLENSPVSDIYEHWKDEHDDLDMEMLRDKQMQEILVLLKSGFLSHVAQPTRREIDRSKISINKDSFDRSTTIPDGIDMECARLSKFMEWKEEYIFAFNYEKLGRYLYKHHKELTDKEKKSIAHFDQIMDLIHEDMARLDARYKVYLKNYEGDELQSIYEECARILYACREHLLENISDEFFEVVMHDVMFGDMKTELKAKLRGASRMTTLCAMLAACKNSGKVFREGVTSDDLARSLSTAVEKPSRDSLKRYIDNGSANYKARIFIFTEEAIKDYLAQKRG